jgi:hypothetical protein
VLIYMYTLERPSLLQGYFFIAGVVTILFMVFNATFNNISVISWRSVLLVEEVGVHREIH